MDEKDRLAAGDKVRRAVLGDAHVDRSQSNRTDFNGEFVDFITRTAWADIWTRPGLARRDRSLIVVAMMTALGRWEELKLHLKGALNNGVTPAEIKEVLLQAAVYAGVPAANTAFHIAGEVLKEAGKI